MRILIAEDDLTSRNILAALLKKKGHEVMETTNGTDAWTVMQKPDAPRMAILDWMMPEMDGLEVVRRIRELQTEQPPYLIMLTAKGEKSDIVVGLDAGADDYLVKPFDAGELKARIEVGRRIVDLQMRLAEQVTALQQALKHIKTLQGIIPICSFCKKIRNDKGYWDQVEAYVGKHSQAEFSHSICPECMAIHYPEYADEVENDENADED
ncbi:response regulator receiver protein [Desulfosarcina variabilis str. Montpellier]|uniref:response regulator transcription factor n=1 Tax=Desulfosarcina variabilis TaxID=2300 RepID=UPI003AFABC94